MNVEEQLHNLRPALDTAIDDARRRDDEPQLTHTLRRSPLLLAAAVVVVIAAAVSIALLGRRHDQHTVLADPAVDLATAKGAVLTKRDLPGFTANPTSKSGNLQASVRAGFARCLHTNVTIFDNITGAQEANSPAFTKNAPDYSTSTISSFIEIAPDRSEVDAEFDDLTSNRAAPCITQLFLAAFKTAFAQVPTTTVQVPPPIVTRFVPGLGDRSVGFLIPSGVSANQPGGVSYDLIFVQRGRASIALYNQAIGHPVDHQLTLSLARKVVERLGNKTE